MSIAKSLTDTQHMELEPLCSGKFKNMLVDNFEENFLKRFEDKISGKRSIQVLNPSMDI